MQHILKESTDSRLSPANMVDAMRTEILAYNLWLMEADAADNLVAQSSPGALPIDAWNFYKQINQRIDGQLIQYDVEDFKDKVTLPGEAELIAYFEEHKESFSDPDSPEPGFRQFPKVKLQYIHFTREHFMEIARNNVDEAEVRKLYDEGVASGIYMRPVKPEPKEEEANPPTEEESPAEEPDDPANPDSSEPDTTENPEEPAQENTTEENSESNPEEPAETESTETDAAEEEKPAEQSAEESADNPAEPGDAESTEEAATEEQPAVEDGSSLTTQKQLVFLLQDEAEVETSEADPCRNCPGGN